MKLETTYLKPRAGTFFGALTLSIVFLFFLGIVIQTLASNDPFDPKLYNWWLLMLLLALGNAIGVTFGARRLQLMVTVSDNLEELKGQTLKFLSTNGLTIIQNKENKTTLKPVKRFHQLFNNWFGMELISVKQANNKIVVQGPARWIERLKSNINRKPVSGTKGFLESVPTIKNN